MSDTSKTKALDPLSHHVLREGGTENAFSGKYNDHKGEGLYHCAGCGVALFDSSAKYDSGSGWPSYTAPAHPSAVSEHDDKSHAMLRTEVRCDACGGHLGHVFPDGPKPSGLRYCINSAALDFVEQGKDEDEGEGEGERKTGSG